MQIVVDRVRKKCRKVKEEWIWNPSEQSLVATELGSMLGSAIADLVEKSVKKARHWRSAC